MSYTLLVIDVQPEFEDAVTQDVLQNCKLEIRKAKLSKASILLVEYFDCGQTLVDLTRLTDEYKRAYTVIKEDDDGSNEVWNAIIHHKLPRKKLRVCGVNTDACVMDTVYGLSELLSNYMKGFVIEVAAAACFTETGFNGHRDGLNNMKRYRNVKILEK